MPSARLGLVVPKRGTPRAHQRNRVKRLVRESFRHEAATLPCADMVVQVFGDMDEDRLRAGLNELFDRIRQELA